jgi:hypothetical protein
MDTITETADLKAGGAFSVDSFCTSHNLSRSLLYQLWSKGAGPDWMQVGARRLISYEAAAKWRRECEQAARATTKVEG